MLFRLKHIKGSNIAVSRQQMLILNGFLVYLLSMIKKAIYWLYNNNNNNVKISWCHNHYIIYYYIIYISYINVRHPCSVVVSVKN